MYQPRRHDTVPGMHTVSGWHLGHRPALDGIRGIAMLMVLANHLHVPIIAPGSVGVLVFFVLSGFLITTLLLEERTRNGAFSLPAFYMRRIRRLVPALIVCVAVAVAVQLTLFHAMHDWELVLGTLGYVSNFLMMDGQFYAHTSLGHTWSLAIEEQYYLTWPLVLMATARFSKQRMVTALSVVIVGVLLWRWTLWLTGASGARIYFGPDTRADALLVGCLLAFVMHGSVTRGRVSNLLVFDACLALFVVSTLPFKILFPDVSTVLAPSIAAGAAGMLIYAAVNGRARWLEWPPLVYMGKRSYGLYLYQGPVLTVINYHFGVNAELARWLLAGPAIWLLAELSWRFVEQPFLRSKGRTPAYGEAPSGVGASSPITPTRD